MTLRLRIALLLFAFTCLGCPAASLPDDMNAGDPTAAEDETSANRAALTELMARAREAHDSAESDVPEGLDVVVLEPLPHGRNADGSLRRDVVVETMSAGPHLVLGALEFVPARAGDEPAGYQIVSFRTHGQWLEAAGLQVGDVVQRVNGHPLWDPERFMAAWAEVPESDALEVTLLRDARTIVLAWPIRDPDVP